MNKMLSTRHALGFLFLLVVTCRNDYNAKAFVPLRHGLAVRRSTSSILRDTEKPDPQIGEVQTFNVNFKPADKQKLKMPQEPASPVMKEEEEEEAPVVPQKIPTADKELWYDAKRGAFYEACPSQALPLATIVERAMDTVEDAVLHARRVPYEHGWIQDQGKDKDIPTVVVLGSGWASHALIKVADTQKMRLIVVSPVNHFVFTPMLASSAVGTVEYRSMTEAVRASNPMIENYIEGKAVDIDVENQVLKVELEHLLEDTRSGPPPIGDIKYDKLVVAVGCKVMTRIVPGAEEYCYKLKSVDDARKLRTAVGECLEYASRPCVAPDSTLSPEDAATRAEARRKRLTWVIIGGGPTGVELAGELSDFIKDITVDRLGAYHKLKGEIKIMLVEGGPCLVPPFEESLREHAFKSLTKEGVDVRLNTFVKEVGDGYIKLQHKDGGEIETIETGFNVWAAGITPAPFVETLLSKLPEEAKGPRGRVNVDKWLRCPTPTKDTFGSILVMGDAAAFETGQQQVLPQTAQVAAQQGAFVARMLDRQYDLSVTPPLRKDESGDKAIDAWMKVRGLDEAPGFKFLNLGILAYLGEGQALSQIHLGDVPVFSYAGSVGFMLWRSVYLVKQVATRNRVLVLFDWLKCKVFGRDITRF